MCSIIITPLLRNIFILRLSLESIKSPSLRQTTGAIDPDFDTMAGPPPAWSNRRGSFRPLDRPPIQCRYQSDNLDKAVAHLAIEDEMSYSQVAEEAFKLYLKTRQEREKRK